jgi:hypothetical protein
MEFTFWSTKELIETLASKCQSFALIYNVYDEDCKENTVKTNKVSHQANRMQALGLASKLQYWLESKLKPDSCDNHCDKTGDGFYEQIDENKQDIVDIIMELNSRSSGLVISVLLLDSTFFMFQSDKARGQSLGLAIELHVWIREKEK